MRLQGVPARQSRGPEEKTMTAGASDPRLAPLFRPLTIAGCTIANRIVMAPMTRGMGPEGVVGGVVHEKAVAYYARRAAGGVGLILTEGIAPSRQAAAATYAPDLASAASLSIWRRIVEAVHATPSGRIMAQLWHAGLLRGAQGPVEPGIASVGPSQAYAEVDGRPYNLGQAMAEADIAATIEDCVRFASAVREIGFDGIEIHGGHGYLFDQFFWDRTNRRKDRYNGDIGARTRFTVETVRAMRRVVGAEFPIGLRFSQWKSPPAFYGERLAKTSGELAAFLEPLVQAGVDFFDCSARRYWEPAFEGDPRTLAEWTRLLSGRPTIAVGSIGLDGPMNSISIGEAAGVTASPTTDFARLAERVGAGGFDMVGVGRALIANPQWADHVRAGSYERLEPYHAGKLETLY
jgi:2,4-dienoyl-CoA reductase-like NADH-dependent reductase (Old Yellow Enzyme family)